MTWPIYLSGIILCMRPANERWCYIVTSSLIGWAHTQNEPWSFIASIPYPWVFCSCRRSECHATCLDAGPVWYLVQTVTPVGAADLGDVAGPYRRAPSPRHHAPTCYRMWLYRHPAPRLMYPHPPSVKQEISSFRPQWLLEKMGVGGHLTFH